MTEEERQKMRKKRQRARKRKKVRKKFLLTIVLIIILLAVFVTTIKIVNPTFDLSAYFPEGKAQQAVKLVDEKVFKNTTTTTTQPTTEKVTTTKPLATKKADYDYDDFSVFAFDTSLQGNQIGNLLGKTQGAVTYSSSYIYYSVPNEGIFRFGTL